MSSRTANQAQSNILGLAIILLLSLAVLFPHPVAAQSTREYTTDGVTAEGPTVAARYFIPMATAGSVLVEKRGCPIQVGNGVLCTGPDTLVPPINEDDSAAQSSSVAAQTTTE